MPRRQFAALVMDHEGRFGVHASRWRGRSEPPSSTRDVDATYDLRPAPILMVLFVVPFLLVGFLWVKLLVRRRRRVT